MDTLPEATARIARIRSALGDAEVARRTATDVIRCLEGELRDACLASLEARRRGREAALERWPLPEGWTWDDDGDAACEAEGIEAYAGIGVGGLQIDGGPSVPLQVISALIARKNDEDPAT